MIRGSVGRWHCHWCGKAHVHGAPPAHEGVARAAHGAASVECAVRACDRAKVEDFAQMLAVESERLYLKLRKRGF